MPHVPDSHTHADHDPALIAAHAAGDATGDELATAAALVASCAPCAELHADLRAIAAATAALPAPARRRDFRLTPEQAASLRPRGWRRLRDALAGPGFRFATPLGTGLATLGLATLLVANLGTVQLGGATSGASAPADAERGNDTMMVQGEPSAGPAASQPPDLAFKPAPSEAPMAADATPPTEPGSSAPSAVTILGGVAVVLGAALVAARLAARRVARAP